ncbi:hypothetical protein OHS71_26475 [Streptomyces sp. NBC_00377]|uniref:hypothetical protein n=1 Tax=unclassified Streptomyces TaxID=2593676 RepID=UPI002E1DDEA0|nr:MULTISPECIES: hypothetical protein [unclassified Streptomyces]
MSAPAVPPTALYDQVLSLRKASPDGLPPGHGFDLPAELRPDTPTDRRVERRTGLRDDLTSQPPKTPLSRRETADAIREALDPLPADADTLHRRFAALGVRGRHRNLIWAAVAAMPLPADEHDTARALARQLSRTGSTVPAVTAGLALLTRLGESEDAPYLSTLGLLRSLTGPAVQALDALDRRSAAVLWLVTSISRGELRPLVHALGTRNDRAVRSELVAFRTEPRFLGATTARRIAEAVRLPELLAEHPADADLLARAARLLVRMACASDGATQLLAYREAPAVYETVVTRAALLPPALAHHATLLSLALDLSSGPGALLDWPSGCRETLLGSLGRLLAEPSWTATATATATTAPAPTLAPAPDAQRRDEAARRLRADWIRRTGRRPFRRPDAPDSGLRIEIVAADPADGEPVEARILVDGRPLVPAVFAHGPAHGPELLLDEGRLRAGPQPRRVRLAEARCGEGCCGALDVTVRCDGDRVVWEDWRRPPPPGTRGPAPELPVLRFDAAAYDAEITRAQADRSWSWPARTLARLIKAGLVERPELLMRWDARRSRIGTGHEDPEIVQVNFWYQPGSAAGCPEGEPLGFRWTVPDDGTPPEAQAAAALRRLAEEDPKTYSRVSVGTRERAEELGYTWPFDDRPG